MHLVRILACMVSVKAKDSDFLSRQTKTWFVHGKDMQVRRASDINYNDVIIVLKKVNRPISTTNNPLLSQRRKYSQIFIIGNYAPTSAAETWNLLCANRGLQRKNIPCSSRTLNRVGSYFRN